MKEYRIAVIPGDGIGKEVVPAGCRVLQAAEQAVGGFHLVFEEHNWCGDYYAQHGRMMPHDALKILEGYDAIYFGAVGWPVLVPDHVALWTMILPIRKAFQQYANVRPAKLLPGIQSPLRDRTPDDIDFVCVRENTEGEYSGVGGRIHEGTPYEVAIQSSVFSRHAVERVMRFSFELARSRPRKKVTSVTKSNACQYSMVLWDEIFEEVSRAYPDVQTEHWHVDAMAARFVTHPHTLDVVVASNLFADVLTDLAGAIAGSLGLAPSANLNPERRWPSMFEAVHGSAPDIAGQGIANPAAQIWAGAMMLDWLGEARAAQAVMDGIGQAFLHGEALTPDLGGRATTQQAADAIFRHVLNPQQGA